MGRASDLGDGFIKLIKMLIGLIVFCVVVSGISGAGDLKKVGRTPQQAHMPLYRQPWRPTSWQLQDNGRAFPPNYLHESWIDWLYWDVELEG